MRSIKLSQLLIFTRQFAAMTNSQLQLSYILQNLAKETPHRKMRDTIQLILDDILHGVDLANAFAKFPNVFNDVYVNVIRAGLESGMLGNALNQIARYLEVADDMNRKVRAAFSYPIFLLVAFVIVFNTQVFIILPQFKTMFDNFNRELPAATQMMLDIGQFYIVYWPHLVVGLVGIVAAFIVWISSNDGRRVWDEIKLKIPVVGRIWRMAALSRLLRTLAVQVQNIVPLVVALELSSSASGNKYIEAIVLEIVDDIKNGEGIADSFRVHEVFSGIVLQMIASGEETGEFDVLLLSAAEYFDSLLGEQVGTLTGLINPLLTIIVGLAIAGMMVAAFLPVFQISRTIG